MKQQVTVEQIHKEFKEFPISIGRLLTELDINLKKDQQAYEKALAVRELGFGASNMDIEDPKKRFEEAKKDHEQLTHMMHRYPFVKFISRRGIDHICKKYKLFHGKAQYFTGTIPEKNMDDILRLKDETFGYEPRVSIRSGLYTVTFSQVQGLDVNMDLPVVSLEQIIDNPSNYRDIQIKDQYGRVYWDYPVYKLMNEITDRRFDFQRLNSARMLGFSSMNDVVTDENIKNSFIKEFKRNLNSGLRQAHIKSKEDKMSIIANHNDFSKLVAEDDHQVKVEIPKVQIPDPIVVKRTKFKDIFAIITAWDKEAMDPLVFNPNAN